VETWRIHPRNSCEWKVSATQPAQRKGNTIELGKKGGATYRLGAEVITVGKTFYDRGGEDWKEKFRVKGGGFEGRLVVIEERELILEQPRVKKKTVPRTVQKFEVSLK